MALGTNIDSTSCFQGCRFSSKTSNNMFDRTHVEGAVWRTNAMDVRTQTDPLSVSAMPSKLGDFDRFTHYLSEMHEVAEGG